MFALTAGHNVLLEIPPMLAGLALAIGITLITLRAHRQPQPERYAALLAVLAAMGPRHLLDVTAVHAGVYEPRHAAVYLPQHEVAQDTAVELGHYVDGDVALVRAYVLVDEPTFAGVGA